MLEIRSKADRKAYWSSFWSDVNRDVDVISSTDVYPLYPADRYLEDRQRILELGCGMGRVVKHYAAQGREIVGTDYELGSVFRLGKERGGMKLYGGDANALPHAAGSFDAVLAFGTLSNIPDPSRALDEIRRVLKPGGILVASVTLDSLARRILTRATRPRTSSSHFAMMAYKPGEWDSDLKRHGYEVLEIAPTVTRLPIFTFFPFLRSRSAPSLEWTVARDGDRGLALNSLGEAIFRTAYKWAPLQVSQGIVGIARKPGAS